MPIWQEYTFWMLILWSAPGFIILGIHIFTISYIFLALCVFAIKGREFNYAILTKDKLILKNGVFIWKRTEFNIVDIEHIGFDRPMGTGSCIYAKLLTSQGWSRRYYLRLVSYKQIAKLVKDLKKLDVAVDTRNISQFIKK